MNSKVNTIANRDNRKRRSHGGRPIRMTLVKGAFERSKPETEEVYISRMEGGIAPSFLVAIQTVRDIDGLRGGPTEATTGDYSVNLLPLH